MVIALRLADFSQSQRDHLVLMDVIPASAIAPEVSQKIETVHVIIDGGGKILQDGATGRGFSYQGGTILSVVAYSEEPGPAQSVVEVIKHGVVSLLGSRAEANLLEGWNTTVLPKSLIEVRQVSTQSNSKRIDVWIVVLGAGILP